MALQELVGNMKNQNEEMRAVFCHCRSEEKRCRQHRSGDNDEAHLFRYSADNRETDADDIH